MGDIKDKFDEGVGKAKEAAGEVTENESLENEGKAEQATSQAKQKLQEAGDAIKDKANEVIGKFKQD